MAQREKVELHSAYMWDCPECGRENFVRAVSRRPTSDECQSMAERAHTSESFMQQFELVETVDSVVCQHCSAEFMTTDCDEDEQLDDDDDDE